MFPARIHTPALGIKKHPSKALLRRQQTAVQRKTTKLPANMTIMLHGRMTSVMDWCVCCVNSRPVGHSPSGPQFQIVADLQHPQAL